MLSGCNLWEKILRYSAFRAIAAIIRFTGLLRSHDHPTLL